MVRTLESERLKEEMERLVKRIYDNEFNELDSHIEDIVTLNELAIHSTAIKVIRCFDKLFPRKDGRSNFEFNNDLT